ncbi:FERM domain-containing protein 7, partial [Frankliniella fusca]
FYPDIWHVLPLILPDVEEEEDVCPRNGNLQTLYLLALECLKWPKPGFDQKALPWSPVAPGELLPRLLEQMER